MVCDMGYQVIESTMFLAKTVRHKGLVDLRVQCFLLRRSFIFVVIATVMKRELRRSGTAN